MSSKRKKKTVRKQSAQIPAWLLDRHVPVLLKREIEDALARHVADNGITMFHEPPEDQSGDAGKGLRAGSGDGLQLFSASQCERGPGPRGGFGIGLGGPAVQCGRGD